MKKRIFAISIAGSMLLILVAIACTGDRGQVGPAGPQGQQGLLGTTGAQGALGPQGPTGPAGERASADPEVDLEQQLSVSDMINPTDHTTLTGGSTLLRSKQGLSMTISTTGLNPSAHTIWWILFNNPKMCDTPDECGAADLPPPFGSGSPSHVADVGTSAVNATGLVVGPDGAGNFSASLKEGTPPAGVNVIFGPGLTDAQGVEVHLLVRDHGVPIAGMVGDQISQLTGGFPCDTCGNKQASIHHAP